MKCLIMVLLITLVVSCCHALPTNGVVPAANGVEEENTIGDGDVIDISSLGLETYGYPKSSSGDLLATWNETSLMKPEEMGGYAEGDILMPPVAGMRNGVRQMSRTWKNGIIPYVIDKTFNPRVRNLILKAIADYHLLTCIRFVPRTTETDYVTIQSHRSGCWSYVGRTGGNQLLNIQVPGCDSKATVLHELLHTIGFLHEQNRAERDDYVNINLDNVNPAYKGAFRKVSAQHYSGYGVSYDYNSVMHYSEYAFSKNLQKTIEAKKKGVKVGQRIGLSRGDVRKVNKMYNCKTEEPKTGWNSAGIFVGGKGKAA